MLNASSILTRCGRIIRSACTQCQIRTVLIGLVLLVTTTHGALNQRDVLVEADGTKVLAFSLFGDSPRYNEGIIANMRLIESTFPGWRMVVYYNSTVPQCTLNSLKHHPLVTLKSMEQSLLDARSWRFHVVEDEKVERFCSRDADSRLGNREFAAVMQWLHSDKDAHAMIDHPGQTFQPLMAGMWCAKSSIVRDMVADLDDFSASIDFDFRPFGDQDFLEERIYPRIRNSLMRHASFGCDIYPDSIPFPTRRRGLEHVGAVYINGKMRKLDKELLRVALKKRNKCKSMSR